MKKSVKLALLGVLVAGGVIAAAVALLSPLEVEADAVYGETATLTFTEQGTYDYSERRTVYPLVAGEVLEVLVGVGETVEEGDVLAVVSAADYLYQIEQLNRTIDGYNAQITDVDQQEQYRRDELTATLENLRGQMTSLEGERQKNKVSDLSLQAQIDIQERLVRRQRSMLDDAMRHYGGGVNAYRDYSIDMSQEERQFYNSYYDALTQSELLLEQLHAGVVPEDIYSGQLQSLQSQIDLVGQQLEKSYNGGTKQYYNAQIASAQSSISQMREKAGQAEITAPISGVVSQLPVREANVTSQQIPVATIGAGGRVEVYVPIREIDGVNPGDTVELILDKRLGKETATGTVVEVEQEAQVQLSALGVEERKVRVLVQPDGGDIPIGFDMDVRFTVYTQEDALVVPKTALFSDGGDDWVWVIDAGTLEKRLVVRGVETREGYIISSGLAEGELVVGDADNQALAEGKRVKQDS